MTRFQANCDEGSKWCAVVLGFSIPLSTVFTQILLVLLITLWFLGGHLKEKCAFIFNHPIAQATFLLYLIFVMGAFYADVPKPDIIESLRKMSKILYIPFLLPLMREGSFRQFTFLAFILAIFSTILFGFIQNTYIHFGLPAVGRYWGACVFKDHIYTSLMVAIASFVMGHFALNESNRLAKLGWVCSTLGAIYFLFFLCDGRSGYLIFALLWLLFFFQRFRKKEIVLSVFALFFMIATIFITSGGFQDRTLALLSEFEQYKIGEADTSLGQRLQFLQGSFNLIKERPWFGWGSGSFKTIYQEHADANQLQITHNPHNEYLNVILQLGLFGLVGLIAFFITLFKSSFKLPRNEKWISQGVLASIVVGCTVNSWLMDSTSGYLFIIMMAACFGALENKRAVYEPKTL